MNTATTPLNKPEFLCLIGLLLLLHYTPVFSQVKNKGLPLVTNFTSESYKASPENWDITQDDRGIMYFANGNGILEYDGSNWTLIPISNQSMVRSIKRDGNGKIYVGGQVELGFLKNTHRGDTKFLSLHDRILEQYQNYDDVWKIHITDEGVIFQTAQSIFVYRHYDFKKVMYTNEIYQMSYYINHKFYTLEQGVGIVTYKNNKLQLIPGGEQFAHDELYLMLRFEHNKIIVVTRDKGFMIFDGKTFTPMNVAHEDLILESRPFCGTNLGSDELIIGTSHNGVFVITKKGKLIQHLNKERGLPSDKIHNVFIDKEKQLWLATENGISHVEINSPFTIFNDNTGLSGSGLSSAYTNKKLYAGTTQGLFYREWSNYDDPIRGASQFKQVPSVKDQVYSLDEIEDGLLIGNHNGAFFLSDTNMQMGLPLELSGSWKTISLRQHPNAYLTGTYRGLVLCEKNSTGHLNKGHAIRGFDESSKYLVEDSDSSIWVTHDNKGIWRLQLDKSCRNVTKKLKYTTDHGLPDNLKNKVFQIHGKVIFGTTEGIYRFNAEKNEFYADTNINKHIGEVYVNSVFQDKKGNIWIETGKEQQGSSSLKFEICMLKKSGKLTYDREYVPFLKFTGKNLDYVGSVDANHIIMGSEEGFLHYDTRFRKNYEPPYHTLIRAVELITDQQDSLVFGGMFIGVNEISSPDQDYTQRNKIYRDEAIANVDSLILKNKSHIELLKKQHRFFEIEQYEEYVLELQKRRTALKENWGAEYKVFDPSENSFRFTFAAPFYENSEDTEFQYKLITTSDNTGEWSQWSTETKKEFTNLAPDEYEFWVRARNIYGNISEPTHYEFAISPPWYQTFWFYSLQISFLILMMSISFYVNRKKKFSRLSFVLTLFTIITVFETIIEIAETHIIDSYAGGTLFFTIVMNIILAMSLNPIEHAIRKRLRSSQEEAARTNLKPKK